MVSIVVVVFNLEKYIKKCLDSILNQSFSEYEIVIINDGSTDNTASICKEIAETDKRIRYIEKKNEGQGSARNLGLKLAKGEYITFVDGDDWIEKDAISKMYSSIEKTKSDICVGDINYVYQDISENRNVISRMRYLDGEIINRNEDYGKISKLRTFTWGKMYRTDFLRTIGFEQKTYAYEDVASIPIVLIQAEKIVYTSTVVYNYLKTRSGNTINDKRKVKDLLVALTELLDTCKNKGFYDLYENALKRLVWGQIKSIFETHHIVWQDIDLEEYIDYKNLIEFYMTCFGNTNLLENECLVYGNDSINCVLKRLLLPGQMIKNIQSDHCIIKIGTKEIELNDWFMECPKDDEDIWNKVDAMFMLIEK